MDKATLKEISYQQTSRFFYSYYSEWRLIQVLSIEKNLESKFEYFGDIIKQTQGGAGEESKSVIAQEIKNGLFFEAIASAIQAVEDLYALLYAGKTPLNFIGKTITYSAGKIKNLITSKQDRSGVATLFYFPIFDIPIDNLAFQQAYEAGLDKLFSNIETIREFYFKYIFYYNQYKHGLSVAFRMYGDYSQQMIADHEKDPKTAYLAVWDNISLHNQNWGDPRIGKKILMPYLTPLLMQYHQQLIRESNFLRFVTPDERISIEAIKDVVTKCRDCINIFGNNIQAALKAAYPMPLSVPHNQPGKTVTFTFPEDVCAKATNPSIFIPV